MDNRISSPPEAAPTAPGDRMRILRAFNLSLGAVVVLVAMFALQDAFDWRAWAVAPLEWTGLLGLLGAPLLHGSVEHIAANSIALLILGTLAGSVPPRARCRCCGSAPASGRGCWAIRAAGIWAPVASPMD